MTDKQSPIRQMDEFRENLRSMANREIAVASPPRRSRWRRRPVLIAGVVGVSLAAGAAGASQLISTGDPVKPGFAPKARYLPGDATPIVAVTAADAAVGPRWAVTVYDTPAGELCAKAGQLRGASVGIVQQGRFRPFAADSPGVCGRPKPGRTVYEARGFASSPPRTLVFGRAGRGVTHVRLTYPSGVARARVGQGGAFIFVLSDRRPPQPIRITGLDRAGRPTG